jgi:hypothetical protein
MENPELDIKAEELWDKIPHVEKLNLLSENRFWEGFSVYHWGYIPEDLKDIIRRKIEENEPNL